jgi:hypothetical protein
LLLLRHEFFDDAVVECVDRLALGKALCKIYMEFYIAFFKLGEMRPIPQPVGELARIPSKISLSPESQNPMIDNSYRHKKT